MQGKSLNTIRKGGCLSDSPLNSLIRGKYLIFLIEKKKFIFLLRRIFYRVHSKNIKNTNFY